MRFSRVLSGVAVGGLILLVGCSGTDEPVEATEFADGGGVTILPGGPTAVPVSSDERSRAIEAVRGSESLAQVVGEPVPEFEAGEMYVLDLAGVERATRFEVVLDEAVDVTGPWWNLQCQLTMRCGYRAGWTGVTVLRVAVNLDTGEVIEIGVEPPSSEEPVAGSPRGNFDVVRLPLEEHFDGLTIENLLTGESRFIEDPDLSADYCPPGLNDD